MWDCDCEDGGERVRLESLLNIYGDIFMNGRITGFIIWALFGCIMIGIGISAFFQKKAVDFWANSKTFPVNDIKKYNHATGKLFIAYGAVFIVLGLPLLSEQNSPYILLSVVGVMVETIALMAIYSLGIAKRYQKKLN